jgi:NADP-dependent 3-hydroxy acid dehydrogenase YdfG
MASKLEGTIALVTGASSGIGSATAVALASQGAVVAIAARRRDRLDEVAAQITDAGGQSLIIEADISDRSQAEAAVQTVVTKSGRLDIVINNAGVMLLGPAEDAPVEEWEQMVAINALGLMYVTRAALPHLIDAAASSERQVADLVNMSSQGGRQTIPGGAAYHFTKFGVVGFSDGIRSEVATRNVRVSVIEPGSVATELSTHVRPDVLSAIAKTFAAVTPLVAQDVAEAVEFVVTRPARAHISELMIRPTNGA